MKNLIIIAAIGKNRELGKNNDLIWKFKEDLTFFRKTTNGHFIVMGRKTLESLPRRLENRRYIIITRNPVPVADMLSFNDIPSFLKFAQTTAEDIYVIGGAAIYGELLPYAGKVILTHIDASADADVFFPEFNKKDFNSKTIAAHNENGINYKRIIYSRKSID